MEDYVLWSILLVSLITDWRSLKILNAVTLPGIVFGLAFHSFTSGWEGLMFSGQGLLLGLGLLLLPYLLGGMGAGDVKLLAAIGSIKGAAFVFYSFLFAGLIGGVMALFVLIRGKELVKTIRTFCFSLFFMRGEGLISVPDGNKPSKTIPYGVAIVLGTFSNYTWGGFL